MANHHQNGGRNVAVPDENRPSWRPQDQSAAPGRNRGNDDDHDYGSWRDRNHRDEDRQDLNPQRWEGSRGSELGYGEDREAGRSTEWYGQGQSGYSAGRYGEDRAQQRHMQNRNEMTPSGHAGYEGRHEGLGTDERFTGRGGSAWGNRADCGSDPERYSAQGGQGRGFEAERLGTRGYGQSNLGQGHYGPGIDRGHEGHDARMAGGRHVGQMGPGYDPRFDQHFDQRFEQRMGYQGGTGPGAQHMGYRGAGAHGPEPMAGAPVRGSTDWSPSQHGDRAQPGQRGGGPHRGKGPQGYQRSDERIREAVCEALADDDQIDASQIHVMVKDGEVTLSGSVESRRIRREAEDCAAAVSGVRDVQIQLRVQDDDRSSSMKSGQPGTNPVAAGGSSQAMSRDNLASNSAVGATGSGQAGVTGKVETDTGSTSPINPGTQDKKPRA